MVNRTVEPSGILLGPHAISAVVEAACANHVTPVEPASLFDVNLSRESDYLRARLGGLVMHRLYYHYRQPIGRICRIFRVDDGTARHRLAKADELIHSSPWRETYAALP